MECARLSFSHALWRQSQPRRWLSIRRKSLFWKRKCVPTNRPPYRLPTRRKLLQKLVLQTKDRHEAFQLLDKVIEQTDIASEADSAWFDQCLALYGSAKCKVGAHSVAWDALTRAANANYQAQKYAESLPLD